MKDLLSRLPNLSTLSDFSPPGNLQKAKAHVAHVLGEITPKEPSAYDLLETYELLTRTNHSVNAFLKLPAKHLKRAPWVMFEPMKENDGVLAENADFLAAFLGALTERLFSPAIITLAMVFIRVHPEDKPYFEFLRKKVVLLVDALNTPKGRSLQLRAERYGLLSKDGPKILGTQLLESGNPLELLKTAGFDDGNMRRGFSLAAVKETIRKMSWKLRSSELSELQLSVLLS
ncbi:MAG: hypothetical protein K8F30_07410, partial [Taibaiella sp.]|nr:hypothetical protein [Taibaiella sp.]